MKPLFDHAVSDAVAPATATEASSECAVRVLCVSDRESVREALARRLAREPDLAMVGSAPDMAALHQLVAELSPHVLVLDLTRQDVSPLDALAVLYADVARVKGRAPVTIVLAGKPTRALERAAKQAGVSAVVRALDGMDGIIEAIRYYG